MYSSVNTLKTHMKRIWLSERLAFSSILHGRVTYGYTLKFVFFLSVIVLSQSIADCLYFSTKSQTEVRQLDARGQALLSKQKDLSEAFTKWKTYTDSALQHTFIHNWERSRMRLCHCWNHRLCKLCVMTGEIFFLLYRVRSWEMAGEHWGLMILILSAGYQIYCKVVSTVTFIPSKAHGFSVHFCYG